MYRKEGGEVRMERFSHCVKLRMGELVGGHSTKVNVLLRLIM